MPKTTRYDRQRPRVTPPHVTLGDLRAAVGLTLDALADRVAELEGEENRPTKGALSAIENGHRGASESMLKALALAYGLREDAISTDYEPRTRRSPGSAA